MRTRRLASCTLPPCGCFDPGDMLAAAVVGGGGAGALQLLGDSAEEALAALLERSLSAAEERQLEEAGQSGTLRPPPGEPEDSIYA
eukprot:SAG25_NODE_283_length_10420_cov_9.898382_7_plen_86_part_00